jgi:hypothetical protein
MTSNGPYRREIEEFASWILKIVDGETGIIEDDTSVIDIPEELLILNSSDSLLQLVKFSYPNFIHNMRIYE